MMYLLVTFIISGIFFACVFESENPKGSFFKSLFFFMILGIFNYFALPVLDPFHFIDLWLEVSAAIVLGLLFNVELPDHKKIGFHSVHWRLTLLGLIVLGMMIVGILSTEMLNSHRYNEMLKVEEVEFENFASDVDVISVEKMICVDQDLARKVVEDRLEEDPGLGSRCQVGRMTLQNLNGSFVINGGQKLTFDNDPVWVAPLEHSSLLKWSSNDTTPGYMLVYANDPTKNYLITEVNGKPLQLRYLESGYFGDDIERHIKANGYASQGLTEHNFEIDPNGNPYWILCNYEPTIVMGGDDAKGVITVDIQTGKISQYTIENAPQWIDHIQPESFIIDQVRYWGEYKLGWWNSKFAQKDVQLPTPGMVLVYSNGQSYWYTGICSAGGDTATSGFMLIDSRTKEAKYYRVAGVNEKEAQRIVEDQNFAKAAKYQASSPVLYNVRGIPTYFMTLKGSSGNVMGYAFMAVTNRQAVGIGSSKREAENNYFQALRRTKNDTLKDGTVATENVKTLTIKDISHENNVYYILFNEVSGKEFSASSEFFPELRWSKPNHKVKVSYNEGNSSIIPLDAFDNLDFNL